LAAGASTADLAVLLIDARQGLRTQARRHSHIVAQFGIREILVAVNKMDLVGWHEAEFERISATISPSPPSSALRTFSAFPFPRWMATMSRGEAA
jgi:bifunctional enzyme CysN/CysC